MSPASNETRTSGSASAKLRAQPLLQRFAAQAAPRLQRDQHHRFLRAAGEQIDRVDRIAGRLHADEAVRDLDVVRADFLAG